MGILKSVNGRLDKVDDLQVNELLVWIEMLLTYGKLCLVNFLARLLVVDR